MNRTINGTRDKLHEAIDAGCDFASTSFAQRADGLTLIAAAIVLATAAHSLGICRALGSPVK